MIGCKENIVLSENFIGEVEMGGQFLHDCIELPKKAQNFRHLNILEMNDQIRGVCMKDTESIF